MNAAPNGPALDIVSQATMAITIVKMLVDLLKLAWGGDDGHPPSWLPPVAALVIGIGVMLLLALAVDEDLTRNRTLAQTILSGLMAGAGSIGVTELHRLARATPADPFGASSPSPSGRGWGEGVPSSPAPDVEAGLVPASSSAPVLPPNPTPAWRS